MVVGWELSVRRQMLAVTALGAAVLACDLYRFARDSKNLSHGLSLPNTRTVNPQTGSLRLPGSGLGTMVRMSDVKKDSAFPRDAHGEIYQGDLTDERTPSPSEREPASHDENLEGEDVDSQAGDAFMRRDRKAAG
jgi:hypothetical protein